MRVRPCPSPASLGTLNALHRTVSAPCCLMPVHHSPTSVKRPMVRCHSNKQLCLLPVWVSRARCFHFSQTRNTRFLSWGCWVDFTSSMALEVRLQPWCLRDIISQNPRGQRTVNPVTHFYTSSQPNVSPNDIVLWELQAGSCGQA